MPKIRANDMVIHTGDEDIKVYFRIVLPRHIQQVAIQL